LAGKALRIIVGVAGLLLAGCAPVSVRETTWSLPWYTLEVRPDGFQAKGARAQYRGERAFQVVRIQNRYLRVDVLPEVGGAVGRVIYKPSGDDLFFYEGRAKNSVPYWEAGVKGSFPWHEHGIRMDQPASYRIIHERDGGVTLAMWLEFSRFDEPTNRQQWGRFGSMLFSQFVRLRPDDATFSVTYRITNPTPFRQGRRVWNDAFFPRNHTPAGAVQADATPPPTRCTTEWIYPATRVCGHQFEKYRPYDPEKDCRIADYQTGMSIFACAMPYGFAGLWYPEVGINRLRLSEPTVAPGAKQFFGVGGDYESKQKGSPFGNFVELWGGTDSVFEGVENWIGPGESFEFTHRFALVRGIGKVSFANDHAAVHLGDKAIEFVTFRPASGLSVRVDGRTVGESIASSPTRPGRVAVRLESGRLEILAGDRVLVDQVFPLPMPVDQAQQDRIRDANVVVGAKAEAVERQGEAKCRGRSYGDALGHYPADSTGRGRIQYRGGSVDAAIATLTAATKADPTDAEAWHLLGVALLEKGDMDGADAALAKARPYAPSAYYRALRHIASGRTDAAADELRALARAIPVHYEGRLLLAHVSKDRALAQQLADEDPADPRAQFVLEAVTGKALALQQLLAEPGAGKRVAEFESATRGRFVAPPKMRTGSATLPATRRPSTQER
jgi:hypothetical protein